MDADGHHDLESTCGYQLALWERVAQQAQHRITASASAWKREVVPTEKSTTVGSQPCIGADSEISYESDRKKSRFRI